MTYMRRFLVVALLLLATQPMWALWRLAEKQLDNQPSEDTEPAVISYRLGGVDYHCSVWMHFSTDVLSTPNSKLRYTAWTSTGSSVTAMIPLVESDPNNTHRYADPVLVKDPNGRLFLVALRVKPITASVTQYTLYVWTSANGGSTWSQPTQIATSQNPRLDKPYAATGPDGRLWVAWVRQTTDLRLRIGAFNASLGTWSWGAEEIITAGFLQPRVNGHNPQVMVESNSIGYVMFTDYDSIGTNNYGRIGLFRYDENAVPPNPKFVKLADALNNTSAMTIYTGKADDDWLTLRTGVSVRAGTVPSARLDRARARICVTWHERGTGGGSKVMLAAYKTELPVDPNRQWITTTLANSSGARDILPALDYDPVSSRFFVSWYHFNANQSTYSNVGRMVTFNSDTPSLGAQDVVTTTVCTTASPCDIAFLTDLGGGRYIIGDYHEVTFSNGSFKTAHIIARSPWVDPYVFTIASTN